MADENAWSELGDRLQAIGCDPNLGPVSGAGDREADLVLVGEAPGETEARAGRPFAGAAGRVLDDALAAAGLSRDRIWTTNVVKCRPVQEAGGRLRNRAPTAAEVRLWRPILEAELRLVAPRLIVCLGAVAGRAIIAPGFAMQKQRGEWLPSPFGAMAMGTYHPAYLFRLDGPARVAAAAALAADLDAARRRLEKGDEPATRFPSSEAGTAEAGTPVATS